MTSGSDATRSGTVSFGAGNAQLRGSSAALPLHKRAFKFVFVLTARLVPARILREWIMIQDATISIPDALDVRRLRIASYLVRSTSLQHRTMTPWPLSQ